MDVVALTPLLLAVLLVVLLVVLLLLLLRVGRADGHGARGSRHRGRHPVQVRRGGKGAAEKLLSRHPAP